MWPPEKAPLPKGGWHAHQKKSVTGGFSFMITGMFRGKVVGAALCGRPQTQPSERGKMKIRCRPRAATVDIRNLYFSVVSLFPLNFKGESLAGASG